MRGPAPAQPQQRDVAICTAQAYAASGDLGSARTELERLLATNTRDTQLLQQLSKLAEEEGDLESAARYQKQLNELAPSDDGASRLAQLYARYGELEEAQAVWSKMASGKSDAHRIFGAIDSLLANQKPQPVMEITESMIRNDPRDWEALYRQGLALQELDKPAEAAQRFQALLQLHVGDDEKSAIAKSRSRDPKLQAAERPPVGLRPPEHACRWRIGSAMIDMIRMACNLESRMYYSARHARSRSGRRPTSARRGWRHWAGSSASPRKRGQRGARNSSPRSARPVEKTPADVRALWDWFYLCLIRYDNAGAFDAGKTCSSRRRRPTRWPSGLISIHWAAGRPAWAGNAYVVRRVSEPKDTTPPLEKAELDHVLACFASLRARRPELAQAQILQNVFRELKRAKRVDEEEKFYRESIAAPPSWHRSPACSAWRPSGATSMA